MFCCCMSLEIQKKIRSINIFFFYYFKSMWFFIKIILTNTTNKTFRLENKDSINTKKKQFRNITSSVSLTESNCSRRSPNASIIKP